MISKEQKRINRLKNKIQFCINEYKRKCLFITISFNDATLSRTNEKTRERIIINYLKNNFAIYIANKDYGKHTEREHYHAFIVTYTIKKEEIPQELKKYLYRIDLDAFKYYGGIYAKGINREWRHKEDYTNELAAKDLANHFVKESTKGSRIIQSRKVPNYYIQLQRLKNQCKINDLEEIKEIERLYN